MIIAKLQGGLGNQMFQYATARGIAPNDAYIYLDHSALDLFNKDTEHFTARNYALDIFSNTKALKAKPKDVDSFFNNAFYNRLKRAIQKRGIIRQVENEFFPAEYLSKFRHHYLDGYFQSERYFSRIRSKIMQEFTFPQLDQQNLTLETLIRNQPNAVSLHVRRGDYLKSPLILGVHGILPLEYYNRAIDMLTSKYPDLSLFIFSDDTEWAKANLSGQKDTIHFVSGNDAADSWKDMALMSCCKHHIVANSSFSWWGAWLSQENGETIAPAAWFDARNVRFNIHDFIPDHWTILN